MTQTDVAPPTIVLFVNNPAYFDQTYQRYIVNRMRDLLPYPEVPIRLIIRERERTMPTGDPAVSMGDDADGQTRPAPRRPKVAKAKAAEQAKPKLRSAKAKTAGNRSRHAKRPPTRTNAPTRNKGKSHRKH